MSEIANELGEGDDGPRSVETGLEGISHNIGSLEFDKDEKRRLVAIMLAGQFYAKMIIQDAEYLRVMLKNEQPMSGATVDKIVAHAIQIEEFIRTGKVNGS